MADPLLLAVTALFLVHTVDDRMVFVNPQMVVSLTIPAGRLVSGKVGCIVAFADGKFLSVREMCHEVRELMKDRE